MNNDKRYKTGTVRECSQTLSVGLSVDQQIVTATEGCGKDSIPIPKKEVTDVHRDVSVEANLLSEVGNERVESVSRI